MKIEIYRMLFLLFPLSACGGQLVGWPTLIEPNLDAPLVVSTTPANHAVAVAPNAAIIATFNRAMDPQTLNNTTFRLQDGAPVAGSIALFGATAILFTPTEELSLDREYTATLTGDVMDLTGQTLPDDYVWDFITIHVLAPDLIAPLVILTHPADEEMDVSTGTVLDAIFSEPMDPLTLSTTTFELRDPDNLLLTGTVSYDAAHLTATFVPDTNLLPGLRYEATLTTGAMDLAGNALEADYPWQFSTPEIPWDLLPVDLGTLETFVAASGAGLTNSNSEGLTTLSGDVGLSPTATCLGDGLPCSLTNPIINGALYANDANGVAAQAKTDLTAAYIDAMSRPTGTVFDDLSGLTLAPGIYSSDSTGSLAVGGTVVLDGQGDENAVWIFQIGSSLTINNDAQVILINGAKAKNVFWAVFASSTLGSNVSLQGSILSGASNSVGTDSVVVGRLLCVTGAITLLSNTITLPPL